MSNEEVDGTADSSSADDAVTTRRDALAKAAAGAAAAGATFAAPRIDGLSLTPSIVSAGTVPGGTVVTSNWNAVPGPLTTDWMTPSGNAQTKNYATPDGTVSVTFNSNRADSTQNLPVSVNFPGFDPPHNVLCGASFTFQGRNSSFPSRNGPHPGGAIPGVSFPKPTSSPFSFTIPEGVNNVGPSPTGNTQWGDITFRFTFC